MVALHFDTDIESSEHVDCSWTSIIDGIGKYAAYHPAQCSDLQEWAALLEGIRQIREED